MIMQDRGAETLMIVTTPGTPVAVALPSVANQVSNQVMMVNRTNGFARFDFGSTQTVPNGACIDATVNGGTATGFSVNPGAQIVVSVPNGVAYVYGNCTVAGQLYVKPVLGN